MARDLIRKLGTISAPMADGAVAGGVAEPFEIRTTNAIKKLWLRITGSVDVATADLSAVITYGVVNLLSSIQLLVNNQTGPINIDGLRLFWKNYFDYGTVPYYADLVSVTLGAGKTFEANLCIDFSLPHFPGGDMFLFKPKLGNLYTLNLTFNAATVLGTPAVAGQMTFNNDVRVDVYAHEILGLKAGANKYNATSLIRDNALVINSDYRVKIPYNNALRELHLHVYNATPALSDLVVSNILFWNRNLDTFRNVETAWLKRFQDFIGPLVQPTPATAGVTPAGIFQLDMALNKDLSSVLITAGMKELELSLNVAAAGSLVLLVNELRDGID